MCLGLLLAIGWWSGNQQAASKDADMRTRLLLQAQAIARMINPELARRLTFTAEDKGTPAFEVICEQLIAYGKQNSSRGIYSMVHRQGKVFFGPENYVEGDPQASPPGTEYRQPPSEYLEVFKNKRPVAVGPVTDEFGTFVSALAPVLDPHNGSVLMVMGVDILAEDWQALLNAARWRALLAALGVFVLLVAGAAAVHWHNRQRFADDLKVKAWIVAPVALALLAALAATFLFQSRQVSEGARRDMRQIQDLAGNQWNRLVFNQLQTLRAQLDQIVRDPSLMDAWQRRDIEALMALARPVYERLQREYDTTHFNFLDPDRTIFLRMNQPGLRGDFIDHSIITTAARTNADAWGLESGAFGIFALRYIRPWLRDGKASGYLELGMETDKLVANFSADLGVDIVSVIRKEYISMKKFNAGKETCGFAGVWGDYPDIVVAHQSLPVLPEDLVRRFRAGRNACTGEDIFRLRQGDRIFDCGLIKLPDAAGRAAAELIVLHDVTAKASAAYGAFVLSLGLELMLLAGILALLWSITSRAETQLAGAFATLRESESLQSILLSSLPVGVVIVDPATRLIESVNEFAATLFGAPADQLLGHRCHSFLCPTAEGACPVCDLGKIVDNSEREMLRADGGRLPILKTVKRIQLHGRDKLLDCFVDITALKQAQADLAASEAKFRQLVDNTNDIIYSLTAEGVFIFVSPAWTRLLGHAPDEVEGQAFTEFVHPDDLPSCFAFMRKVAETGARQEGVEYRVRHKNGEWRWHTSSANLKKDAAGTVIGFDALARDITESRKTKELLVRAKEQFELAVDGSNDGIWDWDLVTNTLFISSQWKLQLGYENDELANEFASFEGRIHPEDKPRVMAYVQEYLEGKLFDYSIEFRMQHKDSSYRWVLARGKAIRNAAGTPVRMAGSHTDITDRKRVEEELRYQTRLQELLTEIASTYISLPLDRIDSTIESSLGEMGAFVDADRVYLFEYDFELRICKNTHEWCAEGITPQIDHLQAVPLDSIPKWVEMHLHGETMHIHNVQALPSEDAVRRLLEPQDILSLIAVPMMDTDQCLGFVGFDSVRVHHRYSDAEKRLLTVFAQMVVNIHKRRKIEQALQQASEQARAASGAKSEFLANMSHEIRTPMNGVIGMTGLLLDTALDKEQRRYAEIVRASGESLLGVINDILDFSKIEAGMLEMEMINFDLRALLDDFAEMLAFKAQEKGLEFLCAAEPDVPAYLRGDPGRLRQVLVNLAGNAVKFTHKGEISVRVSLESEIDDLAVLMFVVRDTGIGIAADKLGGLFNQFTQVDASTTRKYGGTGLGLAISRQLAEALGGDISVTSEEGRGTEFMFRARFQKQGQREHALPPPADIRGARILVVDDNGTNREILLAQIKNWGARADEAADGQSGLVRLRAAAAAGKPYQVAVLDMQMPGMDGEALAKAIRADANLAGTHLVVMTSLGKRGDARRLKEIDFAAYMTKPVRQSDLFDCLATVLGTADSKTRLPAVPRYLRRATRRENVRILLAEDNITNQQVALGILEKLGIPALAVVNGIEALKALESATFNLVLMDVQMQEMDGLECVRRIRDPKSAVYDHSLPVIAMTAQAMAGDREKCLQAGMNDYLAKPISPQALAAMLQKWLPDEKNDGDRQRPDDPEKASHERPSLGESTPLNILLAEDGEDNRLLVQVYLKKTLDHVAIAENGEIAVAMFKSNNYDLVLMDVQMPVLDGYGAAREIRKWERKTGREETPIIALTAHAMAEDAKKSLAAGCTEHLTKPIKKEILLKTIQKYRPSES